MRNTGTIQFDSPAPGEPTTPSDNDPDMIGFDQFSLLPGRRLLLEDGRPARLGSRALELLILLVEHAGEFVTKAEIFRRVWPRTVVVEGNLRVHIAAVRKALGDGRDGRRYIVNSPSRGYSFVAPVVRGRMTDVPDGQRQPPPLASRRLPVLLHRLVGQETTVDLVRTQLSLHRLVTLTGTGGIGKTSVVLAVAAGLVDAPLAEDGVVFVDLASVSDSDLVNSTVAAALGLASVTHDMVGALLGHLQHRCVVIVLDNCEHVIASVARLAEDLLRGAPQVHLLATSREPLRAQGEWVHRIPALGLPPPGEPLRAADALRYAGIELFAERLAASREDFALQDAEADAAARICRRLDGIPLAIELAAARAAGIGIRAVADALDESLTLLNKGRRTAIARHQTLRATLDWSYCLLSPLEQQVLVRLSVFAGAFTLASAHAVGGAGEIAHDEFLEILLELVDKSLVTADVSGEEAFFRLLETTRSHGLDLLRRDPEYPAVQRRHARHCLDLLIEAEGSWRSAPFEHWLSQYGRRLDDVRAALAWSFSPEGDASLGVALAAKSGLLLFQLSLADEHRRCAERALALVGAGASVEPRWEFELNVVYGHMLYHTVGLPAERERALARASQLAEQIGEGRLQALACSTGWMAAYQVADPAAMLRHARRFEQLTSGETDPSWTHMYDRMRAPAFHFAGDQAQARACCERGLTIDGIVRPPFVSGSQINLRVSHGTILARALWLQGHAVQAERMAGDTIRIAIEEGESVALAFLLAITGCVLPIWSGQWALARQRAELLLAHTRKHALVPWRNYGLVYQAVIEWHEAGEPEPGPQVRLPSPPTPPLVELMATLHPSFVGPVVLQRLEDGLAGWCHAEVLRAQAMQEHAQDPGGTEAKLLRALDRARRDGAPAWTLRIATSLARLWLASGRAGEAAELLKPLLPGLDGPGGLDGGHATADQQAALAVLRAASPLPRAPKALRVVRAPV